MKKFIVQYESGGVVRVEGDHMKVVSNGVSICDKSGNSLFFAPADKIETAYDESKVFSDSENRNQKQLLT